MIFNVFNIDELSPHKFIVIDHKSIINACTYMWKFTLKCMPIPSIETNF